MQIFDNNGVVNINQKQNFPKQFTLIDKRNPIINISYTCIIAKNYYSPKIRLTKPPEKNQKN